MGRFFFFNNNKFKDRGGMAGVAKSGDHRCSALGHCFPEQRRVRCRLPPLYTHHNHSWRTRRPYSLSGLAPSPLGQVLLPIAVVLSVPWLSAMALWSERSPGGLDPSVVSQVQCCPCTIPFILLHLLLNHCTARCSLLLQCSWSWLICSD